MYRIDTGLAHQKASNSYLAIIQNVCFMYLELKLVKEDPRRLS